MGVVDSSWAAARADACRVEVRFLHRFEPGSVMKKSLRIALVFLSFTAAISAQSKPSLDDIIAGYLKTVGGADRIQALQTVRRTGKFIGGGAFEAAYRQENKRPNKVRDETTYLGLTGVTAYDGKSGWKIE